MLKTDVTGNVIASAIIPAAYCRQAKKNMQGNNDAGGALMLTSIKACRQVKADSEDRHIQW